MASDDLLDQIIRATEDKKAGGSPPPLRTLDKPTTEMERQVDQRRRDEESAEQRRLFAEAEERARQKAAAAPPEMCGFVVGHRFEVRNCGAEVNGRWVVARIDPGSAGDPSRSLWATRASGAEGAIRFGERKLQDALHAGLVVRLDG